MALAQTALLCGCGSAEVVCVGMCAVCYRRARLSRERFDGQREAVLFRDGYQCRVCGDSDPRHIVVHHRGPGRNRVRLFVTLCRRCHPRAHFTYRPSFAFATEFPLLYVLWREIHPRQPEQRLLLAPASQEAQQRVLFAVAGAG